jgi:adenosylhomocysteine nucleosidase
MSMSRHNTGAQGPLGIVAALPEELGDLVTAMRAEGPVETVVLGSREYHVGSAYGVPCVVALARVGKVAAAATTAVLIHRFEVRAVVFTGVAGGVAPAVRVGDVVVAETLMQHDLDASPIFPRYQVPLLGIERFAADTRLAAQLRTAAQRFIDEEREALAGHLHLHGAQVRPGLVISGDRFVSSEAEVQALRDALPDALAVEMEGAALAQVCFEHGVPCAIVRTISDTADDHAHASFANFLTTIAASYSSGILRRFLQLHAASLRAAA